MSSARFLAIDEPSLGLAPNLRAEVFGKIGQVKADGTSILLVDQNFSEAGSVVDHVYAMQHGRILYDAPGRDALNDERVREIVLPSASTRKKRSDGRDGSSADDLCEGGG